MAAPDEIRTARMLLRKPRLADASLMFRTYAQDAAVTRYLIWRPHRDVAETQTIIGRFLAEWRKGTEFNWLLFISESDELIGSIAARAEDDGFSLGFLVARPYWGRGYIPEAIAAVVDWAWSQPQVSRISAACDVENISSARALEKAGFRREGLLPQYSIHPNISPAPRDCYAYAITRQVKRS